MPRMQRMRPLDALRALLWRPGEGITVEIDGEIAQVRSGATILEAADAVGAWVPRLCHLPGAAPRAACRLCLVLVDGASAPVSACATPVREGMSVRTESPRLRAIQRTILELTLLEHGRCGRPGCEVEALARRLGATGERFPGAPLPAGGPRGGDYITFAPERCVRCDRCVRACALQIPRRSGRGADAAITFDGAATPSASRCTACGDCVAVCPAEALRGVEK